MTLDELLARESIRQTMVNYNISGDRLKAEEFLAVFTEDAIFEIDGAGGQPGIRNEGRDAIRKFFTGFGQGGKDAKPVHQAKFIRHHLSTCHIEFTGADTAKTRTYWTAYTDIGPDHGGFYLDKFRKVGDKWLISHRRACLDWSSPNSLYMGTSANLQKK